MGPVGSTFPHAGEKHERVQVMEIVEAGAAPAPGTDLAGLVRLPLTNEQIAAGAAVECDHGAPIGRNAAIDVFDAMCAAAPAAAQAGQVAVPEGWTVERVGDAIHIKRADGRWCGYMQEIDSPAHRLTHEFLDAMLAAAPSAPAVAQQAPAPQEAPQEPSKVSAQQAPADWINVDERLPDGRICLATYRNAAGKLRIIRAKYASQYEVDADEDAIDQGNCEYNEADDTYYLKAGWLECVDNWDEYSSMYVTEGEVTHWMPLPPLPGAQASTPDGRSQEGGVA